MRSGMSSAAEARLPAPSTYVVHASTLLADYNSGCMPLLCPLIQPPAE